MDELIVRLSTGKHPVAVGGPKPSLRELKAQIRRNYIFIKFTTTCGGTDLGLQLDTAASNYSNADFERGEGTILLEGTTNLNFVPVRCTAEIDLATLQGSGSLSAENN